MIGWVGGGKYKSNKLGGGGGYGWGGVRGGGYIAERWKYKSQSVATPTCPMKMKFPNTFTIEVENRSNVLDIDSSYCFNTNITETSLQKQC